MLFGRGTSNVTPGIESGTVKRRLELFLSPLSVFNRRIDPYRDGRAELSRDTNVDGKSDESADVVLLPFFPELYDVVRFGLANTPLLKLGWALLFRQSVTRLFLLLLYVGVIAAAPSSQFV